ncbi:hypothetical protein Dsin_014026 [Dipteronia sinensis]|uniref:MATH domain-containing protein n=1 Tax=Dipteronia sinensis TaxID=43782 RepID=A0AAE0E9J4_9ROSI|nr:hypothetical protein Dsin_014026 [Dipteronia sinensis]
MAAESILIGRNAPPSHYMIKIESFSLLQTSVNVFSSEEFDVGGYKWKMSIYPTGNYSRNGEDHISVYLELVQTSSLPAGWEVNVITKFFIFNSCRTNISVTKTSFPSDTNVVVKFILRIKEQKNGKDIEFKDNHLFAPNANVRGCDRFLSLSKLEYPNHGFLVNDALIIEANVTLLGFQLANS